jgi:hypothetical protein
LPSYMGSRLKVSFFDRLGCDPCWAMFGLLSID